MKGRFRREVWAALLIVMTGASCNLGAQTSDYEPLYREMAETDLFQSPVVDHAEMLASQDVYRCNQSDSVPHAVFERVWQVEASTSDDAVADAARSTAVLEPWIEQEGAHPAPDIAVFFYDGSDSSLRPSLRISRTDASTVRVWLWVESLSDENWMCRQR